MKAALLYGPGDLRIVEVAAPEPGPGEVVLQIRAALTCGTDRKMYLRGHPALGPYPSRLGHEFAGVVGSVGEGVAGFSPGEPVFCADSAPCGACFQCRGGRPREAGAPTRSSRRWAGPRPGSSPSRWHGRAAS